MVTDPHWLTDFYRTRLGGVAARLVRARVAEFWPDLARMDVLGLGYAAPYLPLWCGNATRCIAAVPVAAERCFAWDGGAATLGCAVDEESLPFPDLFFDRIVVVHGLEGAEYARRFLREVWRVLKDDGRVLLVVPNRRGLWAHAESTPFGHGRPYSPGQLGRLLTANMFRVERRSEALFVPPVNRRLALRTANTLERAGRHVAPGLAGVILAEASKDLFAAVPVSGQRVQRRVVVGAV